MNNTPATLALDTSGQKDKIRNRLLGVDIFRLFLVLNVYLFHSSIHPECQCYYGEFFQPFVNVTGGVCMSGFFMLSGFSYSLKYSKKHHKLITDPSETKKYLLSSILNLYALYVAVGIVVTICHLILKNITFGQIVATLPIEVLCLQSVYDSLFSFAHNNGTWFVSCLIICYLLFPLINSYLTNTKKKFVNLGLVLFSFLAIYMPFVSSYMNISDLYTNPLFRVVEFIIGCLIATVCLNKETNGENKIRSELNIVLLYLLFVLITRFISNYGLIIGNYTMYNVISIPIFSFILYYSYFLQYKSNSLIAYLSRLSYAFFMAQFFTWEASGMIVNFINYDTNFMRIFTCLVVNYTIAVILHCCVEKPARLFRDFKSI